MSPEDIHTEAGRVWEWFNGGHDVPHNTGRYDSESFRVAAAPMIEWLNFNANPHTLVTIQQGVAIVHTGEVSEGFAVPD